MQRTKASSTQAKEMEPQEESENLKGFFFPEQGLTIRATTREEAEEKIKNLLSESQS